MSILKAKRTGVLLLVSLVLLLATATASAPVAAQETASGTISGQVIGESNTVLPGATIELYSSANTSGDPVAKTTAGTDGLYTLTSVAPGEYYITAKFNGQSGFATIVTVSEGMTTTTDLIVDGAKGDRSDDSNPDSTLLQEETVAIDGSTVTIEHDGASAVAVDSFVSAGTEISDLSGSGTSQPGGAIWYNPDNPVTFTLTPPEGAEPGDTVQFDISTDQTTTVELEVIETTAFDFGIELQQEATVTEGESTTITTYPNNLIDQSVSDASLELLVDSNNDGQFSDSETVTTRSVDFNAGEYREVDLTYSNVQLEPDEYEYQARISKDDNAATSYTTGTLTVSEASDSPPSTSSIIEENTVRVDGSTVTINHGGAPALAIDSFDPASVEISDLSEGGSAQPGGAVWQSPSGDTESFTLTPTGADVGDTIEFDVTTDQVTTVSVEVVESQVEFIPPGVDRDVAIAVADDNGEFTPSSIALAIAEAQTEGSVDGVPVSPSDFALIIAANAEQNSNSDSSEVNTPEAVGEAFFEALYNKDVEQLNEIVHSESPRYPVEESDIESGQIDPDSITVQSVSVRQALRKQSDSESVPEEAVSEAQQELEDSTQSIGADKYQLLIASTPGRSSQILIAVEDDSRWQLYVE